MVSPLASATLPDAQRGELAHPQITAVVAGLLAFVMVLFDAKLLNDGDIYWHLSAGEWMLHHGRILRTDPFSYTHAGQPWITHEWLSEIAMALAYRAAGWSGLVLLFAVAFASAVALLAARTGRWLGPISHPVALALGVPCAVPGLLARPHVLALPLLILWTDELLKAREADRAPPLWMAGLMVLWANLHGSFVFGFLLAAPFGLEALWEARRAPWPVLRDWGRFGLLCLAATVCTPHGVAGLIHPFELMSMNSLGAIAEWRAADFAKPGWFEIALFATLFACLGLGVRVPVLRAGLLLVILHMALQHVRHQQVLGLTAPLLLAEPFGRAMGRERDPSSARPFAPAMLLGITALCLAAWLVIGPVVRMDSEVTPKTALQHVPGQLAAQPVFNSYDFGGYLISTGVKPFIDGRNDMYGEALVTDYLKIVRGDPAAFDAAVRKYGLRWTVLAPNEPLAKALDAKPGWRRLYDDRWAVVHERVADLAAPKP